jgi:DNA polymerase (family 10)
MYDQLGIDSIETLRAAAEAGTLRDAKGFGPKFEESVLAALDAGAAEKPAERVVLSRALEVGEAVADALRAHPAAVRVEIAGSARRRADSVKDLDIVAAATDPAALAAALAGVDLIETAGPAGENAARGRAHNGMGIDLRVVAPDRFGNLLQHFTGSARHNVALREAAVRRGLHVSEYGILDDETGETTRCATEEEVYARLGLPWIEPELREDRGELAPGFEPPQLVTVDDIRGDLHCHTTASDGRNTLEEMVHAAVELGYEYLAITDHSATHGFGNHVSPDELRRQIERVRELDAATDGLTVLIGTETNILPDGRPDYDDDLLAELDWVIASVHTSFAMSEKDMTARMVTAIEHPWVDAIGHPTGRKISQRAPYAVDVDALVEAAVRTGTMIEINGAPDRRDLDDVHARAAAEAGVPILIDSDGHGVEALRHVRWAVATARRAWLGPEQIANTRPWSEFAGMRKRARAAAR